jgi:hypothetical protein
MIETNLTLFAYFVNVMELLVFPRPTVNLIALPYDEISISP